MWTIFYSLYWICYSIASVSCFVFLATRHVELKLQNRVQTTPAALEGEVLIPVMPGKSPPTYYLLYIAFLFVFTIANLF